MDGQVAAIRAALDAAGHDQTAILAYAAKYASALYGPFRDAAGVQIAGGGDRRGYQQDVRNLHEARREVALDVAEGADMVMVKPALTSLDVIADVRAMVDVPVAAYHVSGEYAMVKARRPAGLDRRSGGRARTADRGQACRSRLRADLFRGGGGRGAGWLIAPGRRSCTHAPGGSSRAASTLRCARSARWAGTPISSPAARAPTCGTRTATGSSTSCSPTAPRSSAMRIPRWSRRSARPFPLEPRSARRPRAKSCWPRRSALAFPDANRCGWSPRGPRRR